MTEEQAAVLFTEWKLRYDENPEAFSNCEAFQKTPPKTYGEAAARYFLWLITDMEKSLSEDTPKDPYLWESGT